MLSNELKEKIRWGFAAFLLFAVIAVDFASKMMSIVFDAVFVCALLVAVWPLIQSKDSKNP